MQIIEYKGMRALTTAQLGESFEVEGERISKNYHENKVRFKEDKHFFKLEGEELKQFKHTFRNSEVVGKNANALYLWTEKGAWLHAKSLNTDKAWEAYEMLVDDYYAVKEINSITPSYMLEDQEQRALRWIEEFREKKELETQKLMLEQRVAEYEPKVSYVDQILKTKDTVTTTQIAKDYGLTAQELNDILHDEKIQFKQNGQWLLYKKFADQGLTRSQTIDIFHKSGEQSVKLNTRWTQKGRLFIHELLTKLGFKANIDKDYNTAK